jgi:CubicO group peptidase (beta-lactamase class C family)
VTNRLISSPDPSISTMLRGRIEAGDFPSAVYLIAEPGRPIFAEAVGDAVRQPQKYPAALDTIYDFASLTKPLVTSFLCALLFELGKLNPDASVAHYLAAFDRPDKKIITVRQLLTHASGLPAWRPLYIIANEHRDRVVAAIANEPLAYEPGERVVYSDLGFIVLGFILQHLTGKRFDELAQHEMFIPLDLQRTFFNPAESVQTAVAACETGNQYERDMCEHDSTLAKYPSWRTGSIWGQVHDGNAHFLGGVAGHAGLFSTAAEALRLANQFIGGLSELLSSQTCELFRQNMTSGLNEARSFGWQLAATRESTAGPSLPADAFGHTGFTGTSCWVDAASERVYLLLTNRTHDRTPPFANINQVRRDFHTLAANALTQT